MTYDPLTGEGYTVEEARAAWSESMNRSNQRWSLRGSSPAEFYWSFFNFKPYMGRVDVKADGFHWRTFHSDTGEELHAGVTASLYEAYQSVEQNKPVTRPGGVTS
jgi:hypothetical protein